MTRVSSDPYQSPSETFSTLIRAEVVYPLPPFFFLQWFSLATEGQDSSRGSQPPQQLDLSMISAYPLPRLHQQHVTKPQPLHPAANHTIQSRCSLAPTPPHHHLQPSQSFSHTQSRNSPSQRSPHPSDPSLFPITLRNTRLPQPLLSPLHPRQLHSLRLSKMTWVGAPVRPVRGPTLCRPQCNQHYLDPPIPRAVGAYPLRSRSLLLRRRQGDPISEHN